VRTAAAKAARDEARALEPVSVFVSRKTQRLYVRRGFEPILDVPVAIKDPGQPIGTHIFTAVAKADAGLRWSVVTINDGTDAKSALDRITIPQDVLDRIGPTAAVRSSLIVSDEALSPETGKGTEFVAVLSNEPQGGLAMRKRPSSEVRYARQRDAYPEFGYAPQRDRGYYGGSQYRSPFSTW
jgi:hypothetical protein